MQIGLPFDERAQPTHAYAQAMDPGVDADRQTVRPRPPHAPARPKAAPPVDPSIVFARHPRAKRYVIRVSDLGEVRVTVPRWGSLREARAFAAREWAWVETQRRRLHGPRSAPVPALDPAVERVLWSRAAVELPLRLRALAAQFGFAADAVTKISVRNQKWRWGSCSRSGHICLNWRLVQMPADVRDYVIIHELMHLKRMDHSAKFWALVEQACPDYRERRRQLRAHTAS